MRSFTDWLTHAERATDDVEADRAVAEAIALATDAWYWRRIVATVGKLRPLRPARLRELADRALAVALDQPDIWCFREIASARARLLDDRDGAREVLELAELAFADGESSSTSWPLLADGFIAELDDQASAHRCLDHGCAQARARRRVDDLARLAQARDKLGDRARALALAEEAEAMLAGGGDGAWPLASTWEQLDRPAAAVRVLEAATDGATTTREALSIARAWVHHGASVGQPRAFARAAALARTTDDWLTLGEAAFDLRQGHLIGEALAQGLVAAGADVDLRGKVAAGYTAWLGDTAAAEAIGPPGLRPEELAPDASGTAGWDAAPAALFDWLRARVPRAAIERMAGADYGGGYHLHLAALVSMQSSGRVPRQMAWHPGEVVALSRWCEGEAVDHLARAFACTLMCLADEADLATNGPILLESALELGVEASLLALGLVAWCDGRRRVRQATLGLDDAHDPWAVITLAVGGAAGDPDDPRLPGLVGLLAAHHRRAELPRDLARSQRARLWDALLDAHVAPHRARVAALDELLIALGR